MRHPRIAAVGVVLDQDEPAARAEQRRDSPDDRDVVGLEVQRVGHHDPGERRQVVCAEVAREVGNDLAEHGRREACRHGRGLLTERPGVAIDRHDPAARPEKVGQGEREGARARPEVGPVGATGPGRLDAAPQELDMVVVIHGAEASRVVGWGW